MICYKLNFLFTNVLRAPSVLHVFSSFEPLPTFFIHFTDFHKCLISSKVPGIPMGRVYPNLCPPPVEVVWSNGHRNLSTRIASSQTPKIISGSALQMGCL